MPKHVLCADDSVTMQKVVAITFANSEFAVTPAKNADEALALARNHRPDLVLADASMPGRSGYDLCQALKADPNTRNVPVVILCGNSSPYDDVKGRQVGADSFLVKPWDTTTFLDKLAEIMSRTQAQGVATPSHAAAPRMPSAPGVAGPHVMSRPPTPVATGPLKGMTAPGAPPPAPHATPTVMGLPRTVPPGPAMRSPTGPMPPAGLPKPPAGLPRPPLIRGAAPGAIRPGAAMPRMTGPLVTPPAASPPAPQGTPAPVVNPPAGMGGAVRPPPPPRPSAIRSATIMGMPAVSTPPADPVPTPPRRPEPAPPMQAPPPAARPPVTVIAPKSAPTPAPVVAPKAAPTPTPPPPVTVSPRPAASPPPTASAPPLEPPPVAAQARGPEYDAIMKLSREIIERIAWEVVPELAEALLRENLNKIQK